MQRNYMSYYLSRVLYSNLLYKDSKYGVLKDLVATNSERPQVIACIVKTKNGLEYLDFKNISIIKKNGKIFLTASSIDIINIPNNAILLRKHILDKQIVDIEGRKMVRVNDIRLTGLKSGVFVVAVDVGMEGLLRRLGISKLIKKFLSFFGKHLSTRYIVWDQMEAFVPPFLKLSVSSSKFLALHPSEIADIIEDLDLKTSSAIFSSLTQEKAADVLEELEPDVQSQILTSLPVEQAADILEQMPADEVADILDDLKKHEAEELLQEMDKEASFEVRELMEYEEDEVGSIMSKDYLTFKMEDKVSYVLEKIRADKPEVDAISSIYIVNDMNNLLAVTNLRDIIIADINQSLIDIASNTVVSTNDKAKHKHIVEDMVKYNLSSMPVINITGKIVGVLTLNDIVHQLVQDKKI